MWPHFIPFRPLADLFDVWINETNRKKKNERRNGCRKLWNSKCMKNDPSCPKLWLQQPEKQTFRWKQKRNGYFMNFLCNLLAESKGIVNIQFFFEWCWLGKWIKIRKSEHQWNTEQTQWWKQISKQSYVLLLS